MSTATEINSSDALSHATPKADGLIQRASSKRLAGKLGVITGASSGMGLATAKRFVLGRDGSCIHHRPSQGRAGNSRC